jgi:hypothetical protein
MLRLVGIGQDLIDGFRPEKSAAHSVSQAQRAKVRFMMGGNALRLQLWSQYSNTV